jgi:uncharacterized protein (DUF697 family)
MIYDIGVAYGKGEVLNKELLAGVLLTAMGTSAGALVVMQGSKVLVKRATLRAFQQILVILAGRITQQALKSAIAKWLPVVGAAGLAVWANYLTRRIGKKAVEIFEKEIVFRKKLLKKYRWKQNRYLFQPLPLAARLLQALALICQRCKRL